MYIGKVSLNPNNDPLVIGSMLYGVCAQSSPSTITKQVTLDAFDFLDHGITIHVLFKQASTVTNGANLQVNSTSPTPIVNPNGKITWEAGSVISFTYDKDYFGADSGAWIINSSGIGTITSQDVINAIGPLKAMVFKGTLGTNGMITDLPVNAVAGDTYKLVSNFTIISYRSSTGENVQGKEGDLVTAILNNNDEIRWVLIPSGNDTDLFVQKGVNNSNKFLQGNDSWVQLWTDTLVRHDAENGSLIITTRPMVDAKPEISP